MNRTAPRRPVLPRFRSPGTALVLIAALLSWCLTPPGVALGQFEPEPVSEPYVEPEPSY